jgi:TolA-binding protein
VSDIDNGIAGAVGAAIVSAAVAVKEIVSRKKRKTDDPTLAVRVGRMADRVMHMEQEMTTMRHELAQKLDKLEESVDELCIARAKTDEILPVIREQLKEIREELRERRAPTKQGVTP